MGRSEDSIAAAWREQTHSYAQAVNDFVLRGRREGWESAGGEPSDPRTPELAAQVLALVRRANEEGRWRELRAVLPADDTPLAPLLAGKARPIRSLVWVDEETVLATVGAMRDAEVHRIARDGSVAWVPPLVAVGADPTGRVVAFASAYDVEVRPVASTLDPQAGAFAAYELPPATSQDGPFIATVAPSTDGERVLVAREDGVFVVSHDGPRLLSARVGDASPHAALGPDGAVVAVGARGTPHRLIDTHDGRELARVEASSAGEPHLAAFSPDGVFVLFHAASDGLGLSLAAPVDALVAEGAASTATSPTASSAPLDPRFVVVSAGARVDACSFHDGRFVLGDVHGYVRVHGIDGSEGWQLHVGGAVGALAWSPSGARLAIGTTTGAVCFFEEGAPAPTQIGDAPYVEQLRVYFWRDEIVRW
ncbi:MAG: hypothetical protein MUE69_14755 [Myxococcota bacterium]|jgi:hypothetical protein|nr:hypothetical protein [Myxococcota bacterium]